MRTSLLIGLGGTGDWILTNLKAMLLDKKGDQHNFPEVSFRLFDTLATARRQDAMYGEEGQYIINTLEGERAEKIARVGQARLEGNEYHDLIPHVDLRDLAIAIRDGKMPYLNWFQANHYLMTLGALAFHIEFGAGQWRQFGRMGFVSCANNQDARVSMVLMRQMRYLQQHLEPNDALDVYVVCSLAGGTGAGAFIDTAILVRHLANQIGININLYALLVLPGAFDQVTGACLESARSYAAFLEMERMQSVFNQGMPYSVQYGNEMELVLDYKLYDLVYLFDGHSAFGPGSEPQSGLFPAITELLEIHMDKVGGWIINNQLIAALGQFAVNHRGQNIPGYYATFGSWKITLPARLYSIKFTHQTIIRYLDQLVPHQDRDLLDGPEEINYALMAEDIMRSTWNGFHTLLDNRPDRDESDIPRLARYLNQRGIIENLLSLEGGSANRQARRSLLRRVIIMEDGQGSVPTGETTGWPSDRAIDRILNECELRRMEYFSDGDRPGEFTLALEEVLGQDLEALSTRLDQELEQVLRGNPGAARAAGTLARMSRLLAEMDLTLVSLLREVMEPLWGEIDQQRGPIKILLDRLTQKGIEMESTRGYDSHRFSSKNKRKSWRAQWKYLEAYEDYIQRGKLQRLLRALDDLVLGVRDRVRQWKEEVDSWADELVLGRSIPESCYRKSERAIAGANHRLQEKGKSRTSSIGMSVWDGTSSRVDTTMGGFEHTLHQRCTQTQDGQSLDQQWLDRTDWIIETDEFSVNNGRHDNPPPRFKLRVEDADMERQEVCDNLAQMGQEQIDSAMAQESILDYLADNFREDDVAGLFADRVRPMLSINDYAGDRSTYLIYQDRPNRTNYMNILRQAIGMTGAFGHVGATRILNQYDDPHTLTLAECVNMLTQDDIRDIGQAGLSYWQGVAESEREDDLHALRDHCFICEQEAVKVCKFHYDQTPPDSYHQARMLAPDIYRVLEKPKLVRAFLAAWSWNLIGKGFSPAAGCDIWCLSQAPPVDGAPNPDYDRIYSGDEPGLVIGMEDGGRSPSLFDALMHFVFRWTCLIRPGNRVDLREIERALIAIEDRIMTDAFDANMDGTDRKRRNAFYRTMADHYQTWAEAFYLPPDEWPDDLPNGQSLNGLLSLDDNWENRSFRMICQYYFSKEVELWRSRVE